MSGFLIGPVSRRRLVILGRLFVLGLMGLGLVGCSGGGAAAQNNGPIGVQTSQFSVDVENRAGMPLLEVEVAIVPVGRATEFKKFAGRLENGEKRSIALNDFYGRDGTPFSLRVTRPKMVRVVGKDLNNKEVAVDVPWQ